MISDIVPAQVCTSESFTDRTVELFADEFAAVAKAVPRRQREFVTVRACAGDAIGELGYLPASLPPGERGAPPWPAGLVGSMTHCERRLRWGEGRPTDPGRPAGGR